MIVLFANDERVIVEALRLYARCGGSTALAEEAEQMLKRLGRERVRVV